jgi:hypothetical protein
MGDIVQRHGAFRGTQLDIEEMSEDEVEDMVGDPGSRCASYVSASLAEEGSLILREIDAELAFINDPVWVFRDFRFGRDLYTEAAANGEVLLVG